MIDYNIFIGLLTGLIFLSLLNLLRSKLLVD